MSAMRLLLLVKRAAQVRRNHLVCHGKVSCEWVALVILMDCYAPHEKQSDRPGRTSGG